MTRISQKFAEVKRKKRIAFMPFFVAGDPDFDTSVKIGRLLAREADILEIGFPYSDPLADGHAIQAADNRALAAGMNTDRVFSLIRAIRRTSAVPISVLVYANLVYRRGIERFYRDAHDAGIDGVLIPDVPIEESAPFVRAARKTGIDPIFLVTHTTTSGRLKKIIASAEGYLYVVSVLGVTGARGALSSGMPEFIARIRVHTSLPLAVGFGISKRAHIAALKRSGADGAIVGSALVRTIEENLTDKKKLLEKLARHVVELKGE